LINIYSQPNIERWITAQPGLRMRKSPNLKSEKICTIPYGEKVIILDEKNEIIKIADVNGKWTKVKWNDKVGWVFGGFLSETDINNKEKLTVDYLIGYWVICENCFEGYKFNYESIEEVMPDGGTGTWELKKDIIYINISYEAHAHDSENYKHVEYSYRFEVLEYSKDYMRINIIHSSGTSYEQKLYRNVQ
jgi:hypothetical protein